MTESCHQEHWLIRSNWLIRRSATLVAHQLLIIEPQSAEELVWKEEEAATGSQLTFTEGKTGTSSSRGLLSISHLLLGRDASFRTARENPAQPSYTMIFCLLPSEETSFYWKLGLEHLWGLDFSLPQFPSCRNKTSPNPLQPLATQSRKSLPICLQGLKKKKKKNTPCTGAFLHYWKTTQKLTKVTPGRGELHLR